MGSNHRLVHWPLPGWGRLILTGILTLCLAACGTDPYVHQRHTPAGITVDARPPVVSVALAQIDRPYRYGGHDPQGFDCSGLVYYAYQRNGIVIPRTTREQHRRARPVRLQEITPGDLLFFRQRKRRASHVGLYVGKGRFIHASTRERAVTLSLLDNPYWKKRLVSIGRYSN
ncbi:MAG: C40 family peptidase [Chromatiales bacterium]